MKFRSGFVVMILVAGLLGAAAYRHLTQTPRAPAANDANCTREAIRAVADPMERAILSGQCGKRAATTDAK